MISNYLLDKLVDILRGISMLFIGFVLLGAAGIILAVIYVIFESIKEHKKDNKKGGNNNVTEN